MRKRQRCGGAGRRERAAGGPDTVAPSGVPAACQEEMLQKVSLIPPAFQQQILNGVSARRHRPTPVPPACLPACPYEYRCCSTETVVQTPKWLESVMNGEVVSGEGGKEEECVLM